MFKITEVNGNPNSVNIKTFLLTDTSDLDKLPTSKCRGTQNNPNDSSADDCCAVGSIATICTDSSTDDYILTPNDQWVLKKSTDKSSAPTPIYVNMDLRNATQDENYRTVSDAEKELWNNKSDFSGSYNDLTDKPSSLPASDVHDWAKAENKPSYTAEEVGADMKGSAAAAEGNSKKYTDEKIKDLVGISPENLDTIYELSDAITENQDAVDAIESAITNKVDKILGKGLSTNDYTTEEKNKLASLDNNYTSLNSKVTSIESNYANKQYVAEQVSKAGHLKKEIVTTLSDSASAEENVLYILKDDSVVGNDKYEEYMLINGTLTKIGDTSIDLTSYAKTSEVNDGLDDKVDKSVISSIISNKPTCATLDDFLELQRNDKVYQVKIYKYASNPTATCEKLGANEGLVFEPSTDTVEGKDDYSDKIEFMWWHNNYVRNDDGYAIITALETDENYAETGSVDVGSCGMSFYYKWDDSNNDYVILSWSTSPHPELGLIPFSANVPGHSYWCLSAYPSVIASDGLLRSQPNGKIARGQSHNNMITNYRKKGTGYWGAGAERNTFQIIFNALMGGTKNSQALYAGVTNWSIQYDAAVVRDTEDTFFPVTASQASNLEVGNYVSVGYGANNKGTLNKDRNVASMHSYVDDAKILRIEDMADGNKAVYLDVDTGFTTTPVTLTDELSSPIIMSSMHMYTGETNKVIGKHNGSAVSNTSGRHSYRVQGVEYALGAYIVASDTVMDIQSDYSKNVYIAPKGVAHSSSDSVIRNTYTLIGNIPASSNGSGSDYWIGDVTINPETGCWHPSSESASGTQGMCDRLYASGTATSGTREYLQGGYLGHGSAAGSAFLHCGSWLGYGGWLFCGCD